METQLGALLKRLRMLKGVTLRQVKEATGISDAYLSQLESGKADKPSPRILHKLAAYYETSYSDLMEAAGYLEPVRANGTTQDPISASGVALQNDGGDLTEEERKQVARYVEFLRSLRNSPSP